MCDDDCCVCKGTRSISSLEQLFTALALPIPAVNLNFTVSPLAYHRSRRNDLLQVVRPLLDGVLSLVYPNSDEVLQVAAQDVLQGEPQSDFFNHPAIKALIAQISSSDGTQRRALLALLAPHFPHKVLRNILDTPLSSRAYVEARLHAKVVGPGVIPPPVRFRFERSSVTAENIQTMIAVVMSICKPRAYGVVHVSTSFGKQEIPRLSNPFASHSRLIEEIQRECTVRNLRQLSISQLGRLLELLKIRDAVTLAGLDTRKTELGSRNFEGIRSTCELFFFCGLSSAARRAEPGGIYGITLESGEFYEV